MNDESNALFLRSCIDDYQKKGQYTFTRQAILASSNLSEAAFMAAANRLQHKGRIAKPIQGFYVIVPLEYKEAKCLPATWFIDELMRYLELPYYVSLLSAAALYGAGHQQPQTFQILAARPHRDIEVGMQRINIYSTRTFNERSYIDKKTETGYMNIATPEQTAIDLVQFYKQAGYFSQIATVLDELANQIQPEALLQCTKVAGISHAQRLGYLLDIVGHNNLTKPIQEWVARKATKYVSLRPDLKTSSENRIRKWKLTINNSLELDN